MTLDLAGRSVLKYEARGIWDQKTGGKIRLPNFPDLKFDTPTMFGGLGRYACADQLFISSLAACLIATFLYFKGKLQFTPIHLEADVKAKIALAGGRGYRFSSVKAVSDIFSPVTGEVLEVNKNVQETPNVINKSPYQDGWLVTVKASNLNEELKSLLSAEAYSNHIRTLLEAK